MAEEPSPSEQFLARLKSEGRIVSYEMTSPVAAVVKVKWPISYLRIEIVQEKCECGCVDSPDYGPCHDFELGGNGRCAHCDHAEACHAVKKPLVGIPCAECGGDIIRGEGVVIADTIYHATCLTDDPIPVPKSSKRT